MSLILLQKPKEENVIVIPKKYEPKRIVRPEYKQRYELQKLICIINS